MWLINDCLIVSIHLSLISSAVLWRLISWDLLIEKERMDSRNGWRILNCSMSYPVMIYLCERTTVTPWQYFILAGLSLLWNSADLAMCRRDIWELYLFLLTTQYTFLLSLILHLTNKLTFTSTILFDKILLRLI